MKTKYEIRCYAQSDGFNIFLIPTVVVFYREDCFWETGVYTPAFGITFKWLKFYFEFKIQKYYL